MRYIVPRRQFLNSYTRGLLVTTVQQTYPLGLLFTQGLRSVIILAHTTYARIARVNIGILGITLADITNC